MPNEYNLCEISVKQPLFVCSWFTRLPTHWPPTMLSNVQKTIYLLVCSRSGGVRYGRSRHTRGTGCPWELRWLGQRMRTAETVLLHELAGKRGNALSRSVAKALVVIGPQERKVVESLVAKGEIPRTRASDTSVCLPTWNAPQRLDFATRREDGILGAESQPGIAGKLPRSHSR